jgi:hypothetical protein
MDGLALLCNLFADGPVTLRRLRAEQVASLEELERAAPENLAGWLHSSVPQARAFVEEARKLVRRLAETDSRTVPPLQAPPVASAPRRHDPRAGRSAGGLALQRGLIPGLDESVCARLALHQVRTVQALSESAGLALARRTGIPYSTLLELARRARRMLAVHAAGSLSQGEAAAAPLVERELVPFVPRSRGATREAESEFERNDEFTLPVEPESAGPFG